MFILNLIVLALLFVNICFGLQFYHHEGLYSNRLDKASLIIPRKVNYKGETISHKLSHHQHELNSNDRLHYHIDFNNKTLHLELSPSVKFLSPNLIIERHKRDLRSRSRPKRSSMCHYEGSIRGEKDSKVSISSCDGMVGLLKLKKDEYWIEPSKLHKPLISGEHPHVIYQRSALQNNELLVQKKKKRRRRKHRLSNCGTKEPKRASETRIEWQHQGKVIVQGGRKVRRHRTKRSISSPRHVETLVVADSSMVEFHEDNVETYLLTIMNMVSSLYKDPTIGNSIQVVIVRMIVLEDEEAHDDLNVTTAASSTLDSFCKWQQNLNPDNDEDPHHHDTAILVTRKNICTASGCSTLGVANVGGMCRADRSCSVNEDNGITLAHTITHEIGHNFGMMHDTLKTGCEHRNGRILHIMTPSFEADTVHVSWSNCSRREITNFLDQGLGHCLEDMPTDDVVYEFPDMPPGAMYNADHQCRLQFNSTDESIVVCSKTEEICTQLWCMVNDMCITQLRPAATGTSCGHHKWCIDQHCTEIDENPPDPIDGGWGNWSNWSECSRSCGAGVQKQIRHCDHPIPAFGGSYCLGERVRYRICNIEACKDEKFSFRAWQCAQHNNDTIKGQKYTWLPHFEINEPCELYCTDVEDTVIVPFKSAIDGTPCKIGTNDMCINGICRKVGCDWVVDSNATEDQCGVCDGNGETCKTVSYEFTKKLNITEGYYEVTTIKYGTRNILIEEIGPSKNYIAVADSSSKIFYLNGDNLILMSGEYKIAGSPGLYEREHELEKLKIPGPLQSDITLYIVVRGKYKNLGLKYEYTIPINSTKEKFYFWKMESWTACTATCGGGKKFKIPVCFEKDEGTVNDDKCNATTKPEKIVKSCNTISCGPNWWAGPWQLCSSTCHKYGDPDPLRRRSVLCVDQNVAMSDSNCDEKQKPKEVEVCEVPLCNETLDITPNDMDITMDDNQIINEEEDAPESYSEISNIIE